MTSQTQEERQQSVLAWQVADDDDTWEELTAHNETASGAVDAPSSRAMKPHRLWLMAVAAAAIVVLTSGSVQWRGRDTQAQAEPDLVDAVDTERPASDGTEALQMSTFNPEASSDWQRQIRRDITVGLGPQSGAGNEAGMRPHGYRSGYIPYDMYEEGAASGEGNCGGSTFDSPELSMGFFMQD